MIQAVCDPPPSLVIQQFEGWLDVHRSLVLRCQLREPVLTDEAYEMKEFLALTQLRPEGCRAAHFIEFQWSASCQTQQSALHALFAEISNKSIESNGMLILLCSMHEVENMGKDANVVSIKVRSRLAP